MSKPIRKVLKNKLRVLFVPEKDSLTTTVAVLVSAGSDYETKKNNGISHFLEHMCFKGTEKRPRPIDIATELDAMGAQYNAFTGNEYTSYYAKVKNNAFGKAFDVISDIYLNPVFKEEDINIERGVIIEEINMYEDTPRSGVQNLFMEAVYGDQPAGWKILGTKENILKMGRKDFVEYRSRNYLPESTIVFVSGGANQKDVMKVIHEKFGGLKNGRKMKKSKVVEVQKKPKELVFGKKVEQSHFVLGVRAFGVHDKRRFALEVLSNILGGGMSSRLFKRVRDELGAAYYVRSDADLFSDHGLFAVSAGVQHGKLREVIRVALEEFENFKRGDVSEKELTKAKEHLIGNLFISLETSDSLGYFYGFQEVFGGKLMTPEEVAKKVREVTLADIKKVSRDIFKKEHLNFALVGPFKTGDFSDILKM